MLIPDFFGAESGHIPPPTAANMFQTNCNSLIFQHVAINSMNVTNRTVRNKPKYTFILSNHKRFLI